VRAEPDAVTDRLKASANRQERLGVAS